MKFKLEYMFVGLVIIGFLVGYFFAQIPPYHDRTKGKASALILGCIDPRYTHDLAWYVTHNQELHADYDLINLAGASLGVLQNSHPGWKDMFFDHVQLALDLHGISEVWVFDHLDCGAYKAIKFGNLALSDNDPNQHIPEIIKLKGYINLAQPSLGFKGFIMDNSGVVSKVVDDSKGVLLDTVVYPATLGTVGSSRIRAPASEILELRAKAAADYVLVQEHSGTTKGGFGRELIRTKLTPLNTKGSSFNNGSSRGYTLETKVGKLKSGFLNRNRL